MNCHSQIWVEPHTRTGARQLPDDKSIPWTRVHDLPDFVYFNHSIHVKKGVGCETCHGRVDKMPLTGQQNTLQMEWCLDCHRNPEKYVRPRQFVTTMGYAAGGRSEGDRQAAGAGYKIQNVRHLTIARRP